MSDKVTVSFKSKWLWLILGIILVVIAASPVISTYLPATASSPPSTSPSGTATSSTPPPSNGAAVNCNNPCTINIQNSQFGSNPNGIVVKAGTVVTWHNGDDTVHTSTSNTGLWDSGIIQIGASFSHTFSTPGTYPYHCNVHPMSGQITVVS